MLNNGFSGGWFKILRGIRQGCLLSCILFILCIEIFVCLIRRNPEIRGIAIGSAEKKMVQFADDTMCSVRDCRSITCIFDTIEVFSKYSGLKVSIDKSIIMWVGPWEDRMIPAQLNLALAENSIVALGVTIGRKSEELLMKTFYRKIDKMTSKFALWKFRPLTVMGKILITKTFGMSNLIYSMSILESSDDVLKKAQNAINHFIWGGSNSKGKA